MKALLLASLLSIVLSIAAVALARWRRPGVITACGSLMVGGWASNLLDRLGMHYWTAPGSILASAQVHVRAA